MSADDDPVRRAWADPLPEPDEPADPIVVDERFDDPGGAEGALPSR